MTGFNNFGVNALNLVIMFGLLGILTVGFIYIIKSIFHPGEKNAWGVVQDHTRGCRFCRSGRG